MSSAPWPPCVKNGAGAEQAHRIAVALGALFGRPMGHWASPCMPPANVLSPWALQLPANATPEDVFTEMVLPRLPHEPPRLVVDVGAHKGGTFAAEASRAGHAGVAFEPGPDNCAELRRRTAAIIQRAKRRWRLPWQAPPGSLLVRCVAVGAAPSTARFAASAKSDSSSIARGGGDRTRRGGGIDALTSVPVVSLDHELFSDASVAPGSFPNQFDRRHAQQQTATNPRHSSSRRLPLRFTLTRGSVRTHAPQGGHRAQE